jgi:ABC-2 type transport system permease protein
MNTRALGKYVAFARIARREFGRSRGEVWGRVLFFGVILGVFSALWRAIAEAGMPVSARPDELVWYLAITEWIVLSVPPMNVEIESAVRRGDVVYRLPRPVSYVGSLLAEGAGQVSARLPLLGAAGFAFAWFLTESFPARPLALLALVIPLGAFAALVLMTIYVSLGLLAFWLGETMPVYWICQKLLFVFGGLMLPLELYPRVLLDVAAFTPFPSLLYGPASIVLGASATDAARVGASLVFWLLTFTAIAALVFRSARRNLELHGG